VSRELRQTIREMVEEGKSNEAIYNHVQNEYGPNQIAIPHQGYLHRISYGLPYVAVGLMILIAYWLSWTWWIRGRTQPDEDLSDEERAKMDSVTDSIDSPLN
jgi:cytochrome c-type biogenesis protein CcmH/NrfF